MDNEAQSPFWKTKSLSEMTTEEWESLCDGCGRCCLHKLEDEDTGDIHYTNVVCRMLDLNTCCCKRYQERFKLVSDCIRLTPANTEPFKWLPPTCAYRLLDEGKELPEWHPLISNDPKSTQHSGISVRDFAISENTEINLEDCIIDLDVDFDDQ